MAKLPNRVIIGPHEYKILYSKESWDKYAPKQRDNLYGLTLAEQCVILINDKKMNESQIKETILHEVLHGLFALHAFANFPANMPDELHDLEELVILLLSPNLYKAIKDNQELFDWLVEE